MQKRRISKIVKLIWASPCTLVGLICAAIVLLFGGRATRSAGTLEVAFRESQAPRSVLVRWLPFRAITLGHVIIAITRQELERLRAHERVHVHQYEHWGIAFFVAYAASSAWQLISGRNPYWDNYFEVEARLRSTQAQRNEHDV
ncbi:MAG: signal peptide prediction [Burkholderiaceae bacterium]